MWQGAQSGPALVVEIISDDSTRRDREIKRGEYEREGVGEYWVIDPRAGARRQASVTVYRRDAGQERYGPAAAVRSTGVVRSAVVEGFWVRAEWLWQTPEADFAVLLQEILRYPEGPEGPETPEGPAVLPWAGTLLQQGRAEGVRATLRKILHSRFGSIPAALEQRISTTDVAALGVLTTQALEADNLADLL